MPREEGIAPYLCSARHPGCCGEDQEVALGKGKVHSKGIVACRQ